MLLKRITDQQNLGVPLSIVMKIPSQLDCADLQSLFPSC